jgi:23S rRNA (adenine2030-N6)-methyltransferase
LNYRHAFHAGNFADLVKHAALLALLERMQADPSPITVVDTHAGRGLYDLAAAEARKSGEAEAGIVRLMTANDAPGEFAPLISRVAGLNGGSAVRLYPGSPFLAAAALRPDDSYVGFELRPEEHEALRHGLKDCGRARSQRADGYLAAPEALPARGRALLLIDPPFEQPDDYRRIVETVAAARARHAGVQALIWLPLKDLETFDAFLRDLEDAVAVPLLVVEARVRPLTDPMKMNGCALVFLPAVDLDDPLAAIAGWVAQALGEGGASRVYRLQPS